MTRQERNQCYERALKACENNKKSLWSLQRELAQTELFFLLTYVLNRSDCNNDWIYDRIVEVQNNPDGYIDLWAREHYKMLPLNEPIPTPGGWKKHGELKIGDEVFGSDGKIINVVGTSEIEKNGRCYEILFSDRTSIKAGANHKWKVGKRSRKRIKNTKNKRKLREDFLLTTEEIYNWNHVANNRLTVDVSTVLDLPEKKLPIVPYVLGAWLGNGTSAGPEITCSDKDKQIIKEIKKYYPVKKRKTEMRYHIGNGISGKKGTGINPKLRELNILQNKHVPAEYLRSSFKQRLELLQGLMDTDGSIEKRGTATYVSKK
ncbi:MAG: hypothetical protein ACOC80_09845 [Petrotogales bacterium]